MPHPQPIHASTFTRPRVSGLAQIDVGAQDVIGGGPVVENRQFWFETVVGFPRRLLDNVAHV